MAILDSLLGGTGSDSGSSETFVGNTTDIAANPALGVAASDIQLHNDGLLGSTDLGVGAIGLGLSAPAEVLAATQVTHDSDGGLLSGLL
jgi:hypothetical protein